MGDFEEPSAADSVCGVILDFLRPLIARVDLDALTYADPPEQVAAAQQWLLEAGRRQGLKDPAWIPTVTTADPEGWAVIRAHAAWSIGAELFDADNNVIGNFDDHGQAISLRLTEQEAVELSAALAAPVLLVRYADTVAQASAEKAARRRATRRRITTRLRSPFRRPDPEPPQETPDDEG